MIGLALAKHAQQMKKEKDIIEGKVPTKIHYVGGDDWVALYTSNVLHYEGHSIPTFVWLELLEKISNWVNPNIEVVRIEDFPWELVGRAPNHIDEVLGILGKNK